MLDRVCTPENLGPSLVDPVRDALRGPGRDEQLAEYLVGGVLKADLHPSGAHSLKWDMLRADDFVLDPLPNHLFQRDNSCWIYGGVTINPMAKPARQRETLHTRAIYKLPPAVRRASSPSTTATTTCRTSRPRSRAATSTSSAIGTVLIGMGERTTPMAVEMVAKSLFASDQATRVIAIELPHSHAFMHLDTVMSMVDTATFVLYPYFDRNLRSWTVTPGETPGQPRA